jgi:phosphatidylserine/phosphatidylglycerophosphate/cardiolipin synthase-like enzyme/flagellar hook assembly protein FlgD
MYNISMSGVANALVAAKNGGATVRVISDADSAYADEEYEEFRPLYQSLVDAGIAVHTNSQSKTGLMHNKFVIFNDQKVWTGSWNATASSTYSDTNDVLVIASSALAEEYADEFDEMWGGDYGSQKEENTEHSFSIGGVSVESYFAPSDGVKSEIIGEINAASSSVYFLMYSFSDSDIADAMVQKAVGTPAVEVRGVFDKEQGEASYSQLPAFTSAGVPVKLDTFPGRLHNKLIIIDKGGSDPRVITGSYNLTASAEEDNDENIVIIRSGDIADEYYAIFEDIYTNHASPPTPPAEGRLILTEVLARGFFRFFSVWDPRNWGKSGNPTGSSPGAPNTVDSVPPQIIHTPVTDVLVNRPVYVHCDIEDDMYLYSAVDPTLYYRLVADPPSNFTSVRMGALFDSYYAVIPASLTSQVGEDKIEYYITAKDASHNLGSAPPVNAESNPFPIDVCEEGSQDKLVITEIMYDPPALPESKYEWVEVYNTATETVYLDGWTFTDFDGTYEFPEESSIGAGEYRILCNDLSSFNAAHPGVSQSIIYEYGSASIGDIVLPNSWGTVTGAIALINPSGLVVSEVDYSSGWGAQNGKGPNKNTLEKLNITGPDDATNWMYSMVHGGTPGEASSAHYIFTRYDTGGGQIVTRPGIWLDKTLIDPAQEGGDSVKISYRLDRQCQVTVKIYNPPWDVSPEQCYDSGYLVKTLVNGATRSENMDLGVSAHEEVWDGKDEESDPVSGVCRVLVEAVDPSYPTITCRTLSDDTVAAASWVSTDPEEFNAFSHQMVKVDYSLSKTAHVTIGWKYQLPGSSTWQYITLVEDGLFPRPAGSPAQVASKSVTNSYLWDGTDNNGNYVPPATTFSIQLKATGDVYGNAMLSRNDRLQVRALNVSPKSFFDPAKDPPETEEITYYLSKDCNVTLKIVNQSGTVVKTILNNVGQDAGAQEESWDGKDGSATLVPDGKYMVVLTATTDAGEFCREVTESVVCKISAQDWLPE